MKIHSPKAMTERARLYLNDASVNKKTKCKMILLYVIYGHFAQYSEKKLANDLNRKVWYIAGFVPGTVLYLVWKYKYG